MFLVVVVLLLLVFSALAVAILSNRSVFLFFSFLSPRLAFDTILNLRPNTLRFRACRFFLIFSKMRLRSLLLSLLTSSIYSLNNQVRPQSGPGKKSEREEFTESSKEGT